MSANVSFDDITDLERKIQTFLGKKKALPEEKEEEIHRGFRERREKRKEEEQKSEAEGFQIQRSKLWILIKQCSIPYTQAWL